MDMQNSPFRRENSRCLMDSSDSASLCAYQDAFSLRRGERSGELRAILDSDATWEKLDDCKTDDLQFLDINPQAITNLARMRSSCVISF